MMAGIWLPRGEAIGSTGIRRNQDDPPSQQGSSTGNGQQHTQAGRAEMNDKRSRSSVIHLPVAIHKDPASVYGVSVPDLPGCFSAGETVEEAMENVREAIGFHIEGLLEDGAFNGIQASRIDDLKMQEGYADAIWGLVDLDVGRYSVRQTRFNVSWPEYLLARVDAYASAHHETRSGFLAKAAERMLSASASGGDSPSA